MSGKRLLGLLVGVFFLFVGAAAFGQSASIQVTAPTNTDAPAAYTFAASLMGGTIDTTSISWDYGDNNTDTGSPVTHTYTAAGEFNVVTQFADTSGNFYTAYAIVDVTVTPATTISGPAPKWTVMVYMAADNNLGKFATDKFRVMESAMNSSNLNVCAVIDPGTNAVTDPASGTAITTCKYVVITNNNLTTPAGKDFGVNGLDMTDPNTMINFATWAKATYPADKYMLILWNHGGGWIGYTSEDDTPTKKTMSYASLKTALAGVKAAIGKNIDILCFDACLMGSLEIDYLCSSYADFVVSSAEVSYASSSLYGAVPELANDPNVAITDLAKDMTNFYRDAMARNALNDITTSVVDSSKVGAVAIAAKQFATDAQTNMTAGNTDFNNSLVASRDDTTAYGHKQSELYGIDLGEFASKVANSAADATLKADAQALLTAESNAVLYHIEGSTFPGHTGMSIHFPRAKGLNAGFVVPDYTQLDFDTYAQWSNFILAYQAKLAGLDTQAPAETVTETGPTDPSGSGLLTTGDDSQSPFSVTINTTGDPYLETASVECTIDNTVDPSLSPTQSMIIGELSTISTAGATTVPFDGSINCLFDGATSVDAPLFADDSTGDSFYSYCTVNSQSAIATFSTDSTGNVNCEGFFSEDPTTGAAQIDLQTGDTIQCLYPVFDTSLPGGGDFTDSTTWPASDALYFNGPSNDTFEKPHAGPRFGLRKPGEVRTELTQKGADGKRFDSVLHRYSKGGRSKPSAANGISKRGAPKAKIAGPLKAIKQPVKNANAKNTNKANASASSVSGVNGATNTGVKANVTSIAKSSSGKVTVKSQPVKVATPVALQPPTVTPPAGNKSANGVTIAVGTPSRLDPVKDAKANVFTSKTKPSTVAGFPSGAFSNTVTAATAFATGDSVSVTLTLPAALTGTTKWYWYNDNTDKWTAAGATDVTNPSGDNKTFIVKLVKGGFGDNSPANNKVIQDPVFPTTTTSGTSTGTSTLSSGAGVDTGGGGACGAVGLDAVMLIGLAYLMRRKLR